MLNVIFGSELSFEQLIMDWNTASKECQTLTHQFISLSILRGLLVSEYEVNKFVDINEFDLFDIYINQFKVC